MKSKFIANIEYFFVKLIFNIFSRLSFNTTRKFCRTFFVFIFNILKKEKNFAFKNLEIIFKDISKKEKRKIYNKFSKIYGELFACQLKFPSFSKEFLTNCFISEGYENISKILQQKKGCIVATGHLGNWELLGNSAELQGFSLNAIYRPLDNHLIDRYLNEFRTKYGMKLISKFASPVSYIRVLRRNEVLCIVADQNTIKNYVFVPFFGKIAAASRGFSYLHLKTGAPVVFAYSLVSEDFKYYGYITDEIRFDFLYNSLLLEEKYFLDRFFNVFNVETENTEYMKKLEEFKLIYDVSNSFKIKSKEIYQESIKAFENSVLNYYDLNENYKVFIITYFFHKFLESIIEKSPENWLLVHPRFRKQPYGIPSPYIK
jgi:KDO2-lipid IV(A) lauroyltransferase